MDSNEQVRLLAENALKSYSLLGNQKDGMQESINELNKTHKTSLLTSNLPYPHILNGRSNEEIQIFLKDSLIEDKEQLDVIHQVKMLADKETIMKQVLLQDRLCDKMPTLDVDLNLLSGSTRSKKNKKSNV